ncbi:AraC family transcriptional regulator [Marinobacterium mangrovicola]
MLQTPSLRHLKLAEIGYRCGFQDPSHFARAFKQRTGLTPSQFRKAETIA